LQSVILLLFPINLHYISSTATSSDGRCGFQPN